jgi:hypothetical protein
MKNLDLSKEKMESIDRLETLAIKTLEQALDDKREIDDKVKVAVKVVSMVAKNRQTLTAREGIRFSMASSIATEAQLKKYIAVTQPDIRKALAG